MAKSKRRTLTFPMAGVDRRFAFARQRPFTTPSALNVRPDGSESGRERGGSRPGIVKAFDQQLPGPIRFMDTVNVVESDIVSANVVDQTFSEYAGMSDLPNPPWAAITPNPGPSVLGSQGMESEFVLPTISPSGLRLIFDLDDFANWTGYAASSGAAVSLDQPGDIHPEIRASVSPLSESGYFMLGFLFGDSTSWLDILYLKVSLSGQFIVRYLAPGGFSSPDSWFHGDHLFERPDADTDPNSAWDIQFRLTPIPDGTMALFAKVRDTAINRTEGVISVRLPKRVADRFRNEIVRPAFIMSAIDPSGIQSNVDMGMSRFTYATSGVQLAIRFARSILVVASEDTVSIDDASGSSLITVPGSPHLTGTKPLETTEYLQKLYIADYDDAIAKVYDPKAGTLGDWVADFGTVQPDCRLITVFSDRIVLAAPEETPHAWYMSRQGHPNNWDYSGELDTRDQLGTGGPDDPSIAIAGPATDGGNVGAPLTALAPHSDDYMILGTLGTLWVMRGDPNYGGIIVNLSRDVGIISPNAFAYGPSSELLFLSQDGLYSLAPGATSVPQSISRERLPQELHSLNPAQVTAQMEYDVIGRGVHIFLVDNAGGKQHWWFDWETKSFWPVTLREGLLPEALVYYQQAFGGSKTGVLLGCRDGFIRKFFPNANSSADDEVSFLNHVMYGPIRIAAGAARDGMVTEIVAAMASTSGEVAWSIHVGDNAEAAFGAAADASGTWTAGLNPTEHPHIRGNSMFLRLAGTGSAWSVEEISITTREFGRQKII